jgi:ABC-type multidrug transport system fused ATPase/permease subunit
LQQLSLTYPGQSQPVITALTLNIPPGQWMGILGRTGSGKSTLIRALSGLLPPSGGDVLIDGRSIGDIPVHELSELVCVVPQHPHFFGGSIRFNLDPANRHTDAAVWAALADVGAKRLVEQQQGGLDACFASGAGAGLGMSAGERQLLCTCGTSSARPTCCIV